MYKLKIGLGLGIRSKWTKFRRYAYLRSYSDYWALISGKAPVFRYIGWLGNRNVGDEALYEAFKLHHKGRSVVLLEDDFSLLTFIAKLRKDVILVLGGGTLINLNEFLVPIEAAVRSGKPFIVWGTGVADLEFWSKYPDANFLGQESRWIAALKHAKFIGVRGPRSKSWLEGHGIRNCLNIGDPALSIPESNDGEQRTLQRRNVLGINLGSHDPVDGGADALFGAVLAFARHALSVGFRVSFVPLSEIDSAIGERMSFELASAEFEVQAFDNQTGTVMRQIAECDYLVGQRLHATILACAQGVPTLSLSYQPKCLDFLESINCADLSIATNGASAAAIIEAFEGLIQRGDEVRLKIQSARDYFRGIQAECASRFY